MGVNKKKKIIKRHSRHVTEKNQMIDTKVIPKKIKI